jgi:uncharacterized protein (TIGR02453 family)
MADQFTGFPHEAFRFFEGLEAHNNREWFQAHKDEYERACREPMKKLLAELPRRSGPGKISRINRDMRFSRDRAPYKTHIAAGVGGYYISLSRAGLYIGAGIYKPDGAELERLRAAIDSDVPGRKLATIVAALRRKGYAVDTHERLTSAPRGYSADHPRIDLLRMKDIFGGKSFAPQPWMSTRKALDRIRRAMTELQPLRDWIDAHVRVRPARRR